MKGTAMYGFWQDQIDGELRTLRRAEAREQRSVEDQVLHAGHVDQQPVVVPPRPGMRVHCFRVMVRSILAGRWRTRRASLG